MIVSLFKSLGIIKVLLLDKFNMEKLLLNIDNLTNFYNHIIIILHNLKYLVELILNYGKY